MFQVNAKVALFCEIKEEYAQIFSLFLLFCFLVHSTQIKKNQILEAPNQNALSLKSKRRFGKIERRSTKFFRRFKFPERRFICSLCSVPEIKMEIKPFGFTSILCG